MKENKGITMISLIVTIVVMLILSGIGIYFAIGENGMISKTYEARFKEESTAIFDALQLKMDNIGMQQYFGSNETKMSILKEQGYLDSDDNVILSKVTDDTMHSGNGSGKKDVYKVVHDTGSQYYSLYYYDESENPTKIGDLSDYDE